MLIYADFNGLEHSATSPDEVHLDLTGYGTLASLSQHQLRLRVGQRLTLCDADGLHVVAEIGFDPSRRSGWFAKFQQRDIREGTPLEHDYATHMCFKCRLNLKPHLDKVGWQFKESRPHCGTSVMYLLMAPGD